MHKCVRPFFVPKKRVLLCFAVFVAISLMDCFHLASDEVGFLFFFFAGVQG